MSSVPSMEAEGITRAWTIVPVIRKKARATQTQESNSRTRICRNVLDLAAGESFGVSATAASGTAETLASTLGFRGAALERSSFTVFSFGFRNCDRFAAAGGHAHLELNVFGDVVARVTGSAETAGGVADSAAQTFQR